MILLKKSSMRYWI